MTDLRFTVRDKFGKILHRQIDDEHYLSWHGTDRGAIIEAMGSLPIYTRGKVKADLMLRNVPKKELGHYDTAAYELVMSQNFYDNMLMGSLSYDQVHYCEGHYYKCYAVAPMSLYTLHLKYPVYELTQVGLYGFVEHELFQDCRKPYSLFDIDELVELKNWLVGLSRASCIKILVENSNEGDGFLRISYDDSDEKYICRLSYNQRKIFTTTRLYCSVFVSAAKDALSREASSVYGKEVAV